MTNCCKTCGAELIDFLLSSGHCPNSCEKKELCVSERHDISNMKNYGVIDCIKNNKDGRFFIHSSDKKEKGWTHCIRQIFHGMNRHSISIIDDTVSPPICSIEVNLNDKDKKTFMQKKELLAWFGRDDISALKYKIVKDMEKNQYFIILP